MSGTRASGPARRRSTRVRAPAGGFPMSPERLREMLRGDAPQPENAEG